MPHLLVNNERLHHWIHWLPMLFATTVGGGVLLSLVRVYPEWLHAFFYRLHGWQRGSFIFVACVLVAYLICRLHPPRLAHLTYVMLCPPTWLAWIIALFAIAIADLVFGLSSRDYDATLTEWLVYGGCAAALGAGVALLTSQVPSSHQRKYTRQETSASSLTPENWASLESWLLADNPATFDFLGNRKVSERLKALLLSGKHSIGIVGPFGSGKTSIITWLEEAVKATSSIHAPSLLISHHSCWGFETSASSINAMLTDALALLGEYIDTFRLASLPDSYRQTFSAGGKWIESISNLIVAKSSAMDQFKRLDGLVGGMKARLVFVVEDLDRNASRSFDIGEVLAFLQQLKELANVSFVLTAGLTCTDIDFSKLCDHIEYMRPVPLDKVGSLVDVCRERCFDQAAFPHEVLVGEDDNPWNVNPLLLEALPARMRPSRAVSDLLSTPRALRHSLSRTYDAWRRLYGEVDWDHIFIVNVLRFGAGEAFDFVLRHWPTLNNRPSSKDFDRQQVETLKATLKQDWAITAKDTEWEPSAARFLIDMILEGVCN